MNKAKLTIVLVTTLAASGVATTTPAAIALPSGFYVEGNVGESVANDTLDIGSVDNKGVGWNIDGGYKFIPYFAAEVGFTSYAKSTASSNGSTIATDEHFSYDIAAKGILPMSDTGVDLFAKLGWAGVYSKVSGSAVDTETDTAGNVYYALGADYSFLANTAVNIQWARAQGNDATGSLDLYSVGLSYLFG